MEELIKQSKELLATLKKKRKPVCFEFSTDPDPGVRSNKGTYTGQQKLKQRDFCGQSSETSS